MRENELKTYAKLMATRFMEDPGVRFQIQGLKRAELLMTLQFEGQIEAFDQHHAVQRLNEGRGLLIGYATSELPQEPLMAALQQSAAKLMEAATPAELQILQERALQQSEIIPQNWHERNTEGAVYHLLVIGIDKSFKGTGAFRELLMPVIEACEKKKMPIVLETFNPDNIPLYEHFGFKLMEQHTSEAMDLTCYCMTRP